MLNMLYQNQPTATVLIAIALMLSCGFLLSRVTRLIKLPDVTAYILAGILIGPYVFKLIPVQITSNMGFVADMALGFIAFGVGKYFKPEKSKTTIKQILVIAAFEVMVTMTLVVLVMIFVFDFSVSFAFLLGSIAIATAPASTIMTVRQYKAKGNFVNSLLKVIAIDNAVAVVIFHICLIFVQKGVDPAFIDFAIPLIYNVVLVGVGFFMGYVMKRIIERVKSHDSKLIISLVVILALTGACSALNVFPLLPCMALGAAFISFKGEAEVFEMVNKYLPPVVMIFFIYSGMKLDVTQLLTMGLVGVAYFALRIVGKISGSYVGGTVCNSSRRVKKYIGLALIPQASVSIGLAMLATRVLSVSDGQTLSVIILSSAILYELIGPVTAKFAIFMSKSVPPQEILVTNADYISPPQACENVESVSLSQPCGNGEKVCVESENIDEKDDGKVSGKVSGEVGVKNSGKKQQKQVKK